MFNTLKRWLGTRDEDVDASAIASWAGDHGYVVHRDLEQGWVSVEGRFGQRPWQLEYGPPQRHYIEGRELRLWTELELPPAPHLLLMSRSLMDRLEILGVEIDSVRFGPADTEAASMEEVRCVAMYAKVALAGTAGLRPHFGMVASEPIAAQAWLHGHLGDRLARFGAEALQAAPFLLMLRRGRCPPSPAGAAPPGGPAGAGDRPVPGGHRPRRGGSRWLDGRKRHRLGQHLVGHVACRRAGPRASCRPSTDSLVCDPHRLAPKGARTGKFSSNLEQS